MKRVQQGFTLIELMIVVAIIGILAAIALPAYSDYLTRSQVSEAVTLLDGLKSPLAEFGADKNSWPTALINPLATPTAGQLNASLMGKYSSVTPTVGSSYPDGVITATMSAGKASGTKVSLTTKDGGSLWACGTATAGTGTTAVTGLATDTTVDAKYLPTACKP